MCASEQAPAPFALHVDQYLSPNVGSPTLLSIHDSVRRGEENLWKTSPEVRSDRLMRAMQMGLVYLPVSYFTTVIQHEVFGHGYRIRSFGKDVAHVEGYQFGTPPPFGDGGGGTGYEVTDKYAPAHFSTCATGGVEATAIMAHDVRMKWLTSNTVQAKDNLLQLFAHHDLSNYAFSLFFMDDKKEAEGHDLISYTQMLRRTYPKTKIRGTHLAALSFINYANPFDVIGWGAMHNYVVSSHRSSPLPMLNLGKISTLPALRLGLAPHGPEIFLENFMRIQDKPIYTYIKGGFLGDHHYYGLGLEHPHLIVHGNHAFGLKGHFWHHPQLLTMQGKIKGDELHSDHLAPLDYPEEILRQKQLGASLCATYAYQLASRPYGMQLELGHKLAGFLPGETMEAAPIVRGSLSVKY